MRQLRNPGRVARAAVLGVLAIAWPAAAFLLWRSHVPGDLVLRELDVHEYFGAAELERARSYERFLRVEFVLSQLVLLIALALYAVFGSRFMRESAAGRIGTGMLLAMLGLAIVWLTLLPFRLVEHWWQRRHDLSDLGYLEWVVNNWLALGGEFLFVSLAILVVMGLAGPLGDRWWIAGGVVFVGLAALFALALPYLIPGQERLRTATLVADARELARAQGLPEIPVYVQEVGAVTTAPNAEAGGLGPTRRVILWETLLEGGFRDDEVRFVLAHELAHHSARHIPESIGWYALFAFPGAFLIAHATRRRGGMREPRSVPLALFVLVFLSTLALPVQNVITRHLEAEADWIALETARDPDAARSLFRRFATSARAQPSPPTWSYLVIDTHPTLMQRLAMVEAWEERRR